MVAKAYGVCGFAFALALGLLAFAPVASAGGVEAQVRAEARSAGVPEGLGLAVARAESGLNPNARRGRHGEWGMMQVMCGSARGLGFRGACGELQRVDVNLRWGMAYLAEAWRLSRGDRCLALSKYNGGLGARRRLVHYCAKVK